MSRVCPRPPQPDCPLYTQRVTYSLDEPLRRAILTARPAPSLADLVRLEGGRPSSPPPPALLPAPVPIPEPVFEPIKKGDNRE
jgi:hypothetical protein